MLENKESFRLLYQAISELSVRIGDNQIETNSVSLLLLDFDFEHEVFDKLMLAIMKYLGNVSLDDINHRELLELIDQTIPEDRQLNEFVKNKIIIGFANNYFPELQTVANDIKNEMGMSIAKSK
ncbi:hypothetical protein MXE81_02665 [Mammaliicoccus sciuri]|uniref:hypothetical protein n=1 Tax=Mammaliicoccus TaxID=2803850 RepID=UPI000734824B|nr:hypothetical protein [Mammaliicoccus sciuri]OOV36916.1 hypothetical protein BS756_08245 [Staphylococcus sp. MB371]KTT85554.1 hypothetical protein NS1R_06040 [Mammaliicoccus sciuri]KTT86053.1 hypothetical protein NS36R_14205 [Mammaliicoccus sciuri]KTT89106.1 hypothetical protein NS112_07010 [Mammaliicoccus sciuri]KTT94099.1 hypothetical protein NS44R_07980 [Mammaliicoccus sciuri]